MRESPTPTEPAAAPSLRQSAEMCPAGGDMPDLPVSDFDVVPVNEILVYPFLTQRKGRLANVSR